jgi:hypothetical protein
MHYYHSLVDHQQLEVENMKVASYIRGVKRPGDSLFTWVYGPVIYRLAGIYSPTRWASAQYISDSPAAYRSIGPALISGLNATLPRFITYDCDRPTSRNDTVRNQFLMLLTEKYELGYRSNGTCVMVRTQDSPPYFSLRR